MIEIESPHSKFSVWDSWLWHRQHSFKSNKCKNVALYHRGQDNNFLLIPNWCMDFYFLVSIVELNSYNHSPVKIKVNLFAKRSTANELDFSLYFTGSIIIAQTIRVRVQIWSLPHVWVFISFQNFSNWAVETWTKTKTCAHSHLWQSSKDTHMSIRMKWSTGPDPVCRPPCKLILIPS